LRATLTWLGHPFRSTEPVETLRFTPNPIERALPDGILTWDSFGLSSAGVKKRLEEDGGRYMVVLEYVPEPPGHDARAAYRALSLAGDHLDIVVEGCFQPER